MLISAILKTMDISETEFPSPTRVEDPSTWTFYQDLLALEDISVLEKLLLNHDLLNLEYDSLQTEIAEHINSPEDVLDQENLLVSALMLAETLLFVNKHLLDAKKDTAKYAKQVEGLRLILNKHLDYDFPKETSSESTELVPYYVSNSIRDYTSQYNVVRQAVQRSRRMVLEMMSYIKIPSGMQGLDKVIGPLINYLAFMFFLPRTLNNIAITGKNSVSGSWMDERAQNFGFVTRLRAQMSRRGFQMFDDLVWCAVNASLCFVVTGSLSYLVFPILVGQQVCEVSSRVTKAYFNIQPMNEMRNKYRAILANDDLDEEEREEIEAYLSHLDKRVNHETRLLTLNAANSSTILISSVIAIACVGLTPAAPLVGAGISVGATAFYWLVNRYISSQNPDKQVNMIEKVSEHGIFAKKPEYQITSDASATLDTDSPKQCAV